MAGLHNRLQRQDRSQDLFNRRQPLQGLPYRKPGGRCLLLLTVADLKQ
jgi:hypothetical protein